MGADKVRTLVEVVGLLAIVASLVFVGIQMKQSQEIAISTQYQERANAAVEMFTGNLQSDLSLRLSGDRLRLTMFGPESDAILRDWAQERKPQELAWQFNNFLMLFSIYDNNHFQYSAGFLDEDSWLSFQARMKNVLAKSCQPSDVQANVIQFSGAVPPGSRQRNQRDQIGNRVAVPRTFLTSPMGENVSFWPIRLKYRVDFDGCFLLQCGINLSLFYSSIFRLAAKIGRATKVHAPRSSISSLTITMNGSSEVYQKVFHTAVISGIPSRSSLRSLLISSTGRVSNPRVII